MKVAFHAPLKSPDHPVPSGDRQLARALLHALRAGGHDVSVASRFRSFDGSGDDTRQARLAQLGAQIAQRLIARYRRTAERPDVWFTYHLYHKAPDWLGPAVSACARHSRTCVAEASIADARRDGAWALGHAAALAADTAPPTWSICRQSRAMSAGIRRRARRHRHDRRAARRSSTSTHSGTAPEPRVPAARTRPRAA